MPLRPLQNSCFCGAIATDRYIAQELKPGAPQRSWVQSQTTFAKLDKDEEGHWLPRVIKQKIWVEGTSYELQEIYGIENSSAGRSSADTGKQVTCHRL